MFIFMYNIYAETRDINVMSLCQTRCKENPTRTSDSNNISTEVICSLHLIIWIILNTFPNNKVTSSERNSKIACVSYLSYRKSCVILTDYQSSLELVKYDTYFGLFMTNCKIEWTKYDIFIGISIQT
uniref:Uncharacterized protein n=1 Tax=Cacopsylla melanoneura TaxID=428564 RepID=A0A8D9E6W4_9HEMI